MAEIEAVIDRMISRELKNASNHVTRATIKLRVLMKLIQCLDIPIQTIYDTKNLIPVHITCSEAIEKVWLESLKPSSYNSGGSSSTPTTQNNNTCSTSGGGSGSSSTQSSSDEWAVLEKFLAKDFTRLNDLIKLVGILKKKIPHRDLNYIFAVDGIVSTDDHLKLYYDNLSFGLQEDDNDHESDHESFKKCHVRAVRRIFQTIDETDPETIGNVLKKILFQDDENLQYISKHRRRTTTTTTTTSSSCCSSCSSSSHSSDSDDNNDDQQQQQEEFGRRPRQQKHRPSIEKQIELCYKQQVGSGMVRNIARWKKTELENCVKVIEKRRKRKYQSRRRPITNPPPPPPPEQPVPPSEEDIVINDPPVPKTKKVKLDLQQYPEQPSEEEMVKMVIDHHPVVQKSTKMKLDLQQQPEQPVPSEKERTDHQHHHPVQKSKKMKLEQTPGQSKSDEKKKISKRSRPSKPTATTTITTTTTNTGAVTADERVEVSKESNLLQELFREE